MILNKTYEAFGDSINTFHQKLHLLLLIQNIGSGQGYFNLDDILLPRHFPVLSKYSNEDGMVDIPDHFPNFSIREKGNIEKVYNKLDEEFNLNVLPDINDIREYFDPIVDIGYNIEETIVLVKEGGKVSYGKFNIDKTHFKFRIVSIQEDDSNLAKLKYIELQDTLQVIITNIENDGYKIDFVAGGDPTWTEFKVLVTT